MRLSRYIVRRFNRSSPRVFSFFMNLYPPYVFFGVKVAFSADFLMCRLRIANRFYFKNGHGTMFGGAILAASDPIPAVQFSRIFPKTQVWTKAHEVVFRKPARSRLLADITLTPDDISLVKSDLKREGKHIRTYAYVLTDESKEIVAEVRSTVYIRNPRHSVFLTR